MTDQREQNGQRNKVDIAQLQIRVETVTKDVEELKNRHLPAIYDRLGSIDRRIAYWTGGAALAGILFQSIISALK